MIYGARRGSAEQLRACDVIAERGLRGVPDGGGHDLRAKDPFGRLRETQGNGTDTAIEVQYRFIPGKAREFQRLAVQHLRLISVHLIEGRHGQLEFQAAEGVHQIIPAEQRPIFVS